MSAVADEDSGNDVAVYVAGILLGLLAGWLDVRVADLLLTALMVLAATMLLGVWRSGRPWRWVVLVAVFAPLAHLLAYLLWKERPERAQLYESFLGFLTGTVGAYAGSVMRRAIDVIFEGKH
jgi:hypothetical protein